MRKLTAILLLTGVVLLGLLACGGGEDVPPRPPGPPHFDMTERADTGTIVSSTSGRTDTIVIRWKR